MSMNSAKIVCTGCDYQTSEIYRPIRIQYQTASGAVVEASRTKGWCYNCNSYADIERMNRDEFQQELTAQQDQRNKVASKLAPLLSGGLFAKFWSRATRKELQYQLKALDESIGVLRQLMDIAASRVAKARCLKCWSDNTVAIRFNADSGLANGFSHDCGGNLKFIHDWYGTRFHFCVTTLTLNEEGEPL
jgi:hypothetical protein